MTNMNVQKANEKSFFGKNITSKTYFSYQKSPADLTSGYAVHKTHALDHWSMMKDKKADQ